MTRRYWIKFEPFGYPTPLNLGCGVTAGSKESALEMVRSLVFRGGSFEVDSVIENIDIRDLDQRHVLPNMGDCTRHGIWFPLGYSGPS